LIKYDQNAGGSGTSSSNSGSISSGVSDGLTESPTDDLMLGAFLNEKSHSSNASVINTMGIEWQSLKISLVLILLITLFLSVSLVLTRVLFFRNCTLSK
jgi:hypothetical protein